LPLAIQLGTRVSLQPGGDVIRLRSDSEDSPAVVPLDITEPSRVVPAWARYVAGVVEQLDRPAGGSGQLTSTLPIGAGLASSASLEVAVALALGFGGSPLELALLCQRAEQRAVGVPCGAMDQLASAAGVRGHALLIDCTNTTIMPVPIPEDCEIVAVHSGVARRLAASEYAARRAACERATVDVGPLRDASGTDVRALRDPEVRRRARHVVTENARVLRFVDALHERDLRTAGALMCESHRSLREDFEVSTPELDSLVAELASRHGVYGARLTGAGFGGCAVALCEPGAIHRGWRLVASAGARVLPSGAAHPPGGFSTSASALPMPPTASSGWHTVLPGSKGEV
jgi:galactokinase